MRSKFTSAVLLTVLGGGLAYAPPQIGQVSVDYTCSEETQSYHVGLEAMSEVSVGAPAPPGNFTYDFGATAGADEISFTWSAPAGQMFQITAPDGWDTLEAQLDTRWGGVDNPGGGVSDTNPTVQIEGAAGEPLVSSSKRIALSGPGGDYGFGFVTFALTPGKVYQFTSVTLSTTVPDTYAVDFDVPVDNTPTLDGRATKMGDPSPPDPGQWITLVPIPSAPGGTVPTLSEWGVICLVLGLALCAMARMRKMKLQPGSAMG